MRAAVYARGSPTEQEPTGQLEELRTYGHGRGWAVHEYADHGVGSAKANCPALDALLQAVGGREVDVIVCTTLDRLGRPSGTSSTSERS